MRIIFAVLFFFSFIIFSGNAFGALEDNTGLTAVSFMKIGVGARPVGMGEAFVSLADDVNAIYWNPAGLHYIESMQLMFYHNEWFQGIRQEVISYGQSLNLTGEIKSSIGVSVNGLYYGGIEETVIPDPNQPEADPRTGTKLNGYDIVANFAFSICRYVFTKGYNEGQFIMGVNVKGIMEALGPTRAVTGGGDIGVLYDHEPIRAGLAIQNLGYGVKFDEIRYPLPLNAKIGVAYKNKYFPYLAGGLDVNVPILFDFSNPDIYAKAKVNQLIFNLDGMPKINVGIEADLGSLFDMSNLIVLRAGYIYTINKNNELGNLANFTTGIGFSFRGFTLDYAFAPYGTLGLTHRAGLTFDFKEFQEIGKSKKTIDKKKKNK